MNVHLLVMVQGLAGNLATKNVDISDPGIRDRLRALRESANLTKAEVAERAGMSFRTVHDIESGRRRCAQERTLRLLAAALNATYEDLVNGAAKAATHGAISQSMPPSRPASRRVRPAVWGAAVLVAISALGFGMNGWLTRGANSSDQGAVAVMCFENVASPRDPENLGRVLANLVINNLSESRYVRVIGGHRIEESLEPGTFVRGSATDCVGVSKAAREAGIEWVLCGSILRDSPTMVVTSRLENTEDGTVLATQQVNAADGETVFDVAARLAAAVKQDLLVAPDGATEMGLPIGHVTTTSMRAYRHYVAGMENLHRLYRDEARRELRLAVNTAPDFAMAHIMLAHPEIAGGPADVDSCLARARRHADRITLRERLYLDVFEAWSNRDFDETIDALEAMVDEYPNESEAYRLLGRFYHDDGDDAKALAALEAAVRVDPLDGLSINRLAYHYAFLGRYQDAMTAVGRYVELAPREANPYDTRGDLLAWTGRCEEAIESYQAALKRNPTFYPSMQNLGNVLTLTGQYDEARRYLRMMLRSEDDSARARARWYLAMVELHQGHAYDALADLRAGISADRMDGLQHSEQKVEWIARIQAEMGDVDAALTTFQALLDLEGPPAYRSAERLMWYMRALAQVDIHRAVAACDSVFSLLENRSEEIEHVSWACKGWIALSRGDADKACGWFERAVEKRSAFEFQYPLALAYFEAGRFDDAIATLEPALNRYSGERMVQVLWSVKAGYLLGLAYENAGRTRDAVRMYEKFLELWKDADPIFDEIPDARSRLASLDPAGTIASE